LTTARATPFLVTGVKTFREQKRGKSEDQVDDENRKYRAWYVPSVAGNYPGDRLRREYSPIMYRPSIITIFLPGVPCLDVAITIRSELAGTGEVAAWKREKQQRQKLSSFRFPGQA